MRKDRKIAVGLLGGTALVLLLFAAVMVGDVLGEPLQLVVALLLVIVTIALVAWVVDQE